MSRIVIHRAAAVPCLTAVALLLAGGCSHPLFLKQPAAAPVSLVPPPGVAEPAAALPQPGAPALPSYADVDGRLLQTTLARSQDENQLLKDEITALREQLASTSTQLAARRFPAAGGAAVPWAVPSAPGTPPPAGATATLAAMPTSPMPPSPAAMHAAMTQLSVPGVEMRFDGNVVRLELPAERLFDAGGASLLPGGSALLTQVSGEVDRVFPRHFIGIEGHVDTEPLGPGAWGSPHQLTAARAAAVFDFLTARTPLRQGQLFLVAHGANHPVVSNASAAGRRRNRRMELVIYPERIGSEDEPSRD